MSYQVWFGNQRVNEYKESLDLQDLSDQNAINVTIVKSINSSMLKLAAVWFSLRGRSWCKTMFLFFLNVKDFKTESKTLYPLQTEQRYSK